MWYLIIPPIIVVVSLSFVLWYLSRKGADPLVAEKASRLGEEAQEQISFLRTKNFFLRILEKTAYRFKVVLLQMHNGFHNLTQVLKAHRRRFQDEVLVKKSLEQTKASEQGGRVSLRESFLQRFTKQNKNGAMAGRTQSVLGREQEKQPPVSSELSSVDAVLEKPIVRRPKSEETFEEHRPNTVFHDPVSSQSLASFRPMVSETVTHPETEYERKPANISREENLIARIAGNPKDFSAYEGLGDYYLEIGNVNDAKECYRQVLKLSPVQRMVKIKIHRLEKLLGQ